MLILIGNYLFKRIGQLEVHPFSSRWVDKRDALRLKIKPVGFLTIEFIAYNRTSEPISMGTMHPQLVRPTRMRP